MEVMDKLRILSDSAKYDVACTSSGSERGAKKGSLGTTINAGICHSFSADGRCVSLLKVLMTNYCVYDCQYCINRRSNDIERAAFEPEEIAGLTIEFYKRNYIEGLFLSSGVIKNPDYTMENMCRALDLLRNQYNFNGYIHVKTIPGASQELVTKLGMLADRMSINIELPSEKSLNLLAPDKPKNNIIKPMGLIRDTIHENKKDLIVYKSAPKFAPAGQSTQMIIGATPDTDFQILKLSESLYRKFSLKRVFYSAYIPVGNKMVIKNTDPPPLLREHRLYQSDWLIRFYGFTANEILSEKNQDLDPFLDPKCNWAVNHMEIFPLEINKAEYEMLLRVPGIGVVSAKRIVAARRDAVLDFHHLKKLGIVLKRAVYFITCKGKYMINLKMNDEFIYQSLIMNARMGDKKAPFFDTGHQMSFFDRKLEFNLPTKEDHVKCLSGQI